MQAIELKLDKVVLSSSRSGLSCIRPDNLSRTEKCLNHDKSRRHQLPYEPALVFFDGACASCHFVVKFLLRRSRRQRFRFLALQELAGSELERTIQSQLGLDLTSSLIVLKNGELHARSAAVLALFSELGFPWLLVLLLRALPRRIADFIYDAYARRRYQLAGRAKEPDICRLLPPAQQALVLRSLPEIASPFPKRDDVFLSAQWRHLVLVNYTVPADVLKPYIPAGVELDTWEGQPLISLVGFSFVGTSVDGITLPLAADFEEVNLRFYVKRRVGPGNDRRGVVFIREIVPFEVIARTANLLYGERYARAPMEHQLHVSPTEKTVSYRWGSRAGVCRLIAPLVGSPKSLTSGSLAEFITEHYWGYAQKSATESTEYEVEHPRWRVWEETAVKVEGDVARHYPSDIGRFLTSPHSVFVAEGSAMRVMKGRSLC